MAPATCRTAATLADMAADLRNLHAVLRLSPALLVGHSFGAVIAMHAAVSYPDMVRGLILSDPYFPGLAYVEPNLAELQSWRAVRGALLEAGAELDEEVTQLFRVAAELTPPQKQRYGKRMGEASLRWLLQLPRLAPTTCGRDIFLPAGLSAEPIAQVRQPVIALYDEHTSFAATRRFLQENVRDVRVETVRGATHIAVLQSTDAFLQLVQQHCRSLRRSRGMVPLGNRSG